MKNLYGIACLLMSILVLGCGKEENEIIEGMVIDSKSKEPIYNVIIPYAIVQKHQQGWGLGQRGDYLELSTNTDKDGKFSISYAEEYGLSEIEYLKDGYWPRGGGLILPYPDLSKPVELIPIDGTVRIYLSNVTGASDSIYFQVFNPAHYAEGYKPQLTLLRPPDYPAILHLGETRVVDFARPSDETITICWQLEKPQGSALSFCDSIFLPKKGYADYHLSF